MSIVAEANDCEKVAGLVKVIEEEVRGYLDKVVGDLVKETLNTFLDTEADELCQAKRYEHTPERADMRAGYYVRKLLTTAGEVKLKMPRLRNLPFETQIIECYCRRQFDSNPHPITCYRSVWMLLIATRLSKIG